MSRGKEPSTALWRAGVLILQPGSCESHTQTGLQTPRRGRSTGLNRRHKQSCVLPARQPTWQMTVQSWLAWFDPLSGAQQGFANDTAQNSLQFQSSILPLFLGDHKADVSRRLYPSPSWFQTFLFTVSNQISPELWPPPCVHASMCVFCLLSSAHPMNYKLTM